jgi:AICAR transformylase/IMP cyclohydrolase PurH
MTGSDELADLRFAWAVCKLVKSNTIVFARAGATIAVGARQLSRVHSARLAAMKATGEGLTVAGAAGRSCWPILGNDSRHLFRRVRTVSHPELDHDKYMA